MVMDHLSSSQINLYLQCGLKYKFQYIDLLPKTFRPAALAFGSAFHVALAWFHEQKMIGREISVETLFKIFDADWYCQKIDVEIRFKDGEGEMVLAIMAKEMLSQYAQQEHNTIVGCEMPFTIPLINSQTGESLGINLEGYFDLIEAEDAIVEFKTSAQALSASDVDSRLQITAYSYAYQLLNHRPPKKLKVVTFIKGKRPRISMIETKRDENDYNGFLYVVREVYAGIQHKVFIPRNGFWCKECEYASCCPLWAHKVNASKEEELASVAA